MTRHTDSARRSPLLPVLPAQAAPLRADAERNRKKLLAAAADAFARQGVAGVSVDEIVTSAGVGKGTLYRIFGDKSGLAVALLDERDRRLQQRILRGAPPLGPGMPARERLPAFVTAYVSHVVKNLELVLMSQTARPGARFEIGAHQFWHAHLSYLLGDMRASNPHLAADVLMAAMSAEQIAYWTQRQRYTAAQIARQISALATDIAV